MEVDGKCEMASYTGPVIKPETNPDEPEDQLPSLIKDKVSNGKINTKVRCERCSSLVLSPGMAKYVTKKGFLPFMKKKSEHQKPEDGEAVTDCWVLKDMFDFDNVGFSNTVKTIKYLVCADCEVGPIGWHDTTVKNEFFIAVDRVKYD